MASIAWTAGVLIAGVTVLGTAIPSAPAYIGTYELTAVSAGAALGLPSDSVLAIGVLAHAVTTGLLAILGIAVLVAAAGRLSGDRVTGVSRRQGLRQ